MEKRVKIVYALAFAWIAITIVFFLVFSLSVSQEILPAPGEISYNPDTGNLEVLLVSVIIILGIVLLYFAFSHLFWKNEEKRGEWKPLQIEERDKKYSSMNGGVKIIDKEG